MSLPLTLVSKVTSVAPFGCYGAPTSGDSVVDSNYAKHSVITAVVPLDKNYASTGAKQAVYVRDFVGTMITLDGKVGIYGVSDLTPVNLNGHYVLQGIWWVNNGPANVPAGGTANAVTPWLGYIDPGNVAGPLSAPTGTGGGTTDLGPLTARVTTLEGEVAEQYRRLNVDDQRFTTDEAAITALQGGTPVPPTPSGTNTLITAPGVVGIVLQGVNPADVKVSAI